MWRHSLALVLFLTCCCFAGTAAAQASLQRPGGDLTCHKQLCAQPTNACQVLESAKCVHGGGPPRCPAIVSAPNGASCDDGNVCTSRDSCQAGACGGTPVVCSSASDVCTAPTGCATPCGPNGCTVEAAQGVLSPKLIVPAGALSSNIALNMFDEGGDPNDSSVFHVYSFAPAGTQFAVPATVDLPAPPLSAGQTPVIEVSDNGTTWTEIATALANGRVTGPIAHFSKCRTRGVVQGGLGDLIVLDAVGYQERVVQSRLIPPPGEAGSCFSGDFFGLCFKVKNPTNGTKTSSCPVPTPTPPPPGCFQVHVVPWQCQVANRTLPPFDPTNPTAYEGQHCDRSAGLLIPCPETIYNFEQFLPGGLAGQEERWVDLNFLNAPQPVNGVNPLTCIATSGLFIGFDVLFREPTGNPGGACTTAANCDWQAGIRSAKLGPFIEIPFGTNVWLPPGVGGCAPTPPATTCQRTCGLTTCSAEWEWLVNHEANYPTLRCVRPGPANPNPPPATLDTLINCAQAQPTDIANKNWFVDSAQ